MFVNMNINDIVFLSNQQSYGVDEDGMKIFPPGLEHVKEVKNKITLKRC